ncbi:MAG: hypothetical protein ACTSV5_10945 [Promethearchaeota archaeon]
MKVVTAILGPLSTFGIVLPLLTWGFSKKFKSLEDMIKVWPW